jgi:hypothetical protein
MCMEDIRLGRSLNTQVKQVSVTDAAGDVIVAPDQNRTRLIISTLGTDPIWIWPTRSGTQLTAGFVLTAGAPQMILRVEEWGNLVCNEWHATSPAGVQVCSIMEATLEKS